MAINFRFKDWVFNRFPTPYRDKDTYKDSQGKGLLERYLTNFGIEYDDEMVLFIHDFMDILNVNLTPEKFLPFIGYTLGSPPTLGLDVDGNNAQRKFLSYLVSLYKIKGTAQSYNLLFNLLGLECTIILFPKNTNKKYDTLKIYDDPTNTIQFDLSCEPCQEYSINYWNKYDDPLVPTINTIPSTIIDTLQSIICFVQPIDCKLKLLNHAIQFQEQYSPLQLNTITITQSEPNAYDMGFRYDSSDAMDTAIVTGTNIYSF